jgi:hypothetical protein
MGEVRRAVAVKVLRHRDGAARDPRKRNPCVATAWDAMVLATARDARTASAGTAWRDGREGRDERGRGLRGEEEFILGV